MITIKQTNLILISGGNPAVVAAGAAGVAVVTGTAALIQSFDTITTFGDKLGEKIYNQVNPDSGLGPMEYRKSDYTQAYLDYRHPNNNSWDNFHSGFGSF